MSTWLISIRSSAALVVDRHALAQVGAGRLAQRLERAQDRAGVLAEDRVVPLAFELLQHDQRDDEFVFGEAAERAGVREQD